MNSRKLSIALPALAAVIGGGVAGSVLESHAAGPVSQYVFSPKPIAPNGTLAAGASVAVTMTAEDSTGAAVPGATVYVKFKSAGGSASVGTTTLTKNPQPFVTDGAGHIAISYRAASPLPAVGMDQLEALNAASGATIIGKDPYSYVKVSKYSLKPKPIAATGTLAAGATVNITLTAINSSGAHVPNAVVYLSFFPAAGGGSAASGGKALGSTAQAFTTNSSGQLTIVYNTPATLPTAGSSDMVEAANAASHSTVFASDTYTY